MSQDPHATLPTAGAAPHAVDVRVFRLVVVHGPGAGATTTLTSGGHDIGRQGHVEGPMALPDAELSRQHARIEESAGGWQVRDLGSRNGTFVQGVRCTTTLLGHGAIIRVGGSILLFEHLDLPANVALEPETETLPGPSVALQRIRGELGIVAAQSIPVLVLGQSGVGKELVAEALHRLSGRKGAFVPVNCAAIAPELAESELFGHAAGAFTGAQRRSDGLFAAADGGTLFLDEVGELPLELQPKLLRALARGEVRPVGSTSTTRVDVRVVAATHRDVLAAEREGALRTDLLARLAGWTLRIPPLSERKEDVLAIARRILAARGHRAGLTADAAEALLLHEWHWNVRELEHVITAASIRSGGQPLAREHLPPELASRLRDRVWDGAPPLSPAVPMDLLVPRGTVPSDEDLRRVFDHFGGNVARVADYFRKDRRQVYRWLERAGVDPDAYRAR